MRWRRGQSSDYVIDRRGRRGMGGGGGMAVGGLGGIGVIVFLLLQVLGGGGDGSGGNIFGQLPQPAGPASEDPNIQQGTGGEADDELEDFMRAVMNDLQATWTEIFEREGQTYQPTSLVLFTDGVSTACGSASSATGPFYCPADSLAYIDLGFFRELSDRFGAAGDFAQAYVIAHENGHHVENLLGELEGEDVAVELRADCYAGVWASTLRDAGDITITEDDIREAINAAEAIGDDRLNPGSSPETWTHGSSAQRVEAFTTGLESGGDPDAC
jgi:uncharacterized protein